MQLVKKLLRQIMLCRFWMCGVVLLVLPRHSLVEILSVTLFLGLLCTLFGLHFFVAHCRSLLAEAMRVTVSARRMRELGMKECEPSGEDFPHVMALARLCERDEGQRTLRFVQIYYHVLTVIYWLSGGSAPRVARHAEFERAACSHFAVVVVETRLASMRQLVSFPWEHGAGSDDA